MAKIKTESDPSELDPVMFKSNAEMSIKKESQNGDAGSDSDDLSDLDSAMFDSDGELEDEEKADNKGRGVEEKIEENKEMDGVKSESKEIDDEKNDHKENDYEEPDDMKALEAYFEPDETFWPNLWRAHLASIEAKAGKPGAKK